MNSSSYCIEAASANNLCKFNAYNGSTTDNGWASACLAIDPLNKAANILAVDDAKTWIYVGYQGGGCSICKVSFTNGSMTGNGWNDTCVTPYTGANCNPYSMDLGNDGFLYVGHATGNVSKINITDGTWVWGAGQSLIQPSGATYAYGLDCDTNATGYCVLTGNNGNVTSFAKADGSQRWSVITGNNVTAGNNHINEADDAYYVGYRYGWVAKGNLTTGANIWLIEMQDTTNYVSEVDAHNDTYLFTTQLGQGQRNKIYKSNGTALWNLSAQTQTAAENTGWCSNSTPLCWSGGANGYINLNNLSSDTGINQPAGTTKEDGGTVFLWNPNPQAHANWIYGSWLDTTNGWLYNAMESGYISSVSSGNGTANWTRQVRPALVTTRAIIGDYIRLFVAIGNGATDRITALNLDGTQNWTSSLGSNIPYDICIDPARDNVYAVVGTGYLNKYTTSGTKVWNATTRPTTAQGNSIACGSFIYTGTSGGNLSKTYPNGTIVWGTTATKVQPYASAINPGCLALDEANGYIYAGHQNGNISKVAISNAAVSWGTGQTLVQPNGTGQIYALRIDDTEGAIYTGHAAGVVCKTLYNGTTAWCVQVYFKAIDSIQVGIDDVYAGDSNGFNYKLKKSDGSWDWVNPISITFQSQTPADLNITNVQGNPMFINYSITGDNINTSTIRIYYKSNDSIDNIQYYLNGTAHAGYFPETVNASSGTNYSFRLLDNEIYPGTFMVGAVSADNMAHTAYTTNNKNDYIKMQILNVSDVKNWGIFEIMANSTANAAPANLFYCNGSYIGGDKFTSSLSNCTLIGTLAPTTNYSHCHLNASCHNWLPFTFNTTDGTINGLKVTPDSYFAFGGAKDWSIWHVAEEIRVGTTATTENNGNSWTDQTYTVDSHLHQFLGNASFYYYVCANYTNGTEVCSSVREDLMELGGLPPTAPFVVSPENTTYTSGNLVSITWLPSISPNEYAISYYNISLTDVNGTFISTIVESEPSTSYGWDTLGLAEGQYEVSVEAFDVIGQHSIGYSEVFTIRNPDIIPPTYTNNSTNDTLAGVDTLFSLEWLDSSGLSSYIFSFDNGTGELINDSAVEMTGTSNWSNVTKTVNSTAGSTIRWCVYANDTDNNWNSTSCDLPFNYTTTSSFTPTYGELSQLINATAGTNVLFGAQVNVTGSGTCNLTIPIDYIITYVQNSSGDNITSSNGTNWLAWTCNSTDSSYEAYITLPAVESSCTSWIQDNGYTSTLEMQYEKRNCTLTNPSTTTNYTNASAILDCLAGETCNVTTQSITPLDAGATNNITQGANGDNLTESNTAWQQNASETSNMQTQYLNSTLSATNQLAIAFTGITFNSTNFAVCPTGAICTGTNGTLDFEASGSNSTQGTGSGDWLTESNTNWLQDLTNTSTLSTQYAAQNLSATSNTSIVLSNINFQSSDFVACVSGWSCSGMSGTLNFSALGSNSTTATGEGNGLTITKSGWAQNVSATTNCTQQTIQEYLNATSNLSFGLTEVNYTQSDWDTLPSNFSSTWSGTINISAGATAQLNENVQGNELTCSASPWTQESSTIATQYYNSTLVINNTGTIDLVSITFGDNDFQSKPAGFTGNVNGTIDLNASQTTNITKQISGSVISKTLSGWVQDNAYTSTFTTQYGKETLTLNSSGDSWTIPYSSGDFDSCPIGFTCSGESGSLLVPAGGSNNTNATGNGNNVTVVKSGWVQDNNHTSNSTIQYLMENVNATNNLGFNLTGVQYTQADYDTCPNGFVCSWTDTTNISAGETTQTWKEISGNNITVSKDSYIQNTNATSTLAMQYAQATSTFYWGNSINLTGVSFNSEDFSTCPDSWTCSETSGTLNIQANGNNSTTSSANGSSITKTLSGWIQNISATSTSSIQYAQEQLNASWNQSFTLSNVAYSQADYDTCPNGFTCSWSDTFNFTGLGTNTSTRGSSGNNITVTKDAWQQNASATSTLSTQYGQSTSTFVWGNNFPLTGFEYAEGDFTTTPFGWVATGETGTINIAASNSNSTTAGASGNSITLSKSGWMQNTSATSTSSIQYGQEQLNASWNQSFSLSNVEYTQDNYDTCPNGFICFWSGTFNFTPLGTNTSTRGASGNNITVTKGAWIQNVSAISNFSIQYAQATSNFTWGNAFPLTGFSFVADDFAATPAGWTTTGTSGTLDIQATSSNSTTAGANSSSIVNVKGDWIQDNTNTSNCTSQYLFATNNVTYNGTIPINVNYSGTDFNALPDGISASISGNLSFAENGTIQLQEYASGSNATCTFSNYYQDINQTSNCTTQYLYDTLSVAWGGTTSLNLTYYQSDFPTAPTGFAKPEGGILLLSPSTTTSINKTTSGSGLTCSAADWAQDNSQTSTFTTQYINSTLSIIDTSNFTWQNIAYSETDYNALPNGFSGTHSGSLNISALGSNSSNWALSGNNISIVKNGWIQNDSATSTFSMQYLQDTINATWGNNFPMNVQYTESDFDTCPNGFVCSWTENTSWTDSGTNNITKGISGNNITVTKGAWTQNTSATTNCSIQSIYANDTVAWGNAIILTGVSYTQTDFATQPIGFSGTFSHTATISNGDNNITEGVSGNALTCGATDWAQNVSASSTTSIQYLMSNLSISNAANIPFSNVSYSSNDFPAEPIGFTGTLTGIMNLSASGTNSTIVQISGNALTKSLSGWMQNATPTSTFSIQYGKEQLNISNNISIQLIEISYSQSDFDTCPSGWSCTDTSGTMNFTSLGSNSTWASASGNSINLTKGTWIQNISATSNVTNQFLQETTNATWELTWALDNVQYTQADFSTCPIGFICSFTRTTNFTGEESKSFTEGITGNSLTKTLSGWIGLGNKTEQMNLTWGVNTSMNAVQFNPSDFDTCPVGYTCYNTSGTLNFDAFGNNSTVAYANESLAPVTNATAITNTSASYTFGTWTSSPYVNITLTCSDSGSGCNITKYCLDTSNSCTPTTNYTGVIKIDKDGLQYIRYFSDDNVGNNETTQYQNMMFREEKYGNIIQQTNATVGYNVSFSIRANVTGTGICNYTYLPTDRIDLEVINSTSNAQEISNGTDWVAWSCNNDNYSINFNMSTPTYNCSSNNGWIQNDSATSTFSMQYAERNCALTNPSSLNYSNVSATAACISGWACTFTNQSTALLQFNSTDIKTQGTNGDSISIVQGGWIQNTSAISTFSTQYLKENINATWSQSFPITVQYTQSDFSTCPDGFVCSWTRTTSWDESGTNQIFSGISGDNISVSRTGWMQNNSITSTLTQQYLQEQINATWGNDIPLSNVAYTQADYDTCPNGFTCLFNGTVDFSTAETKSLLEGINASALNVVKTGWIQDVVTNASQSDLTIQFIISQLNATWNNAIVLNNITYNESDFGTCPTQFICTNASGEFNFSGIETKSASENGSGDSLSEFIPDTTAQNPNTNLNELSVNYYGISPEIITNNASINFTAIYLNWSSPGAICIANCSGLHPIAANGDSVINVSFSTPVTASNVTYSMPHVFPYPFNYEVKFNNSYGITENFTGNINDTCVNCQSELLYYCNNASCDIDNYVDWSIVPNYTKVGGRIIINNQQLLNSTNNIVYVLSYDPTKPTTPSSGGGLVIYNAGTPMAIIGVLVLLFASGLFALAGFKLRINPFIQYACFFFAIIWLFLAMSIAGMSLAQGDMVMNSSVTTVVGNQTFTNYTFTKVPSATSGLIDIGIYVFAVFILLIVIYIGYKLTRRSTKTMIALSTNGKEVNDDYLLNEGRK